MLKFWENSKFFFCLDSNNSITTSNQHCLSINTYVCVYMIKTQFTFLINHLSQESTFSPINFIHHQLSLSQPFKLFILFQFQMTFLCYFFHFQRLSFMRSMPSCYRYVKIASILFDWKVVSGIFVAQIYSQKTCQVLIMDEKQMD